MKSRLDYAEVYITNVCNYSCTNCQSLNNFAFKGHQKWQDYELDYKEFSQKLDIDVIQIMGGEPTLNPDFDNWVKGISELWPNSKLQISTNGSRLDKITNEIYQTLLKHRGTLWITCHDVELYDSMLEFSTNFLSKIIFESNDPQNYNFKEQYKKSETDSSIQLKTISKKLVDINQVEVILDWSQAFVPSALEVINKKEFKLRYDSDPQQAHEICYFKTCHQLNKGKLYKCPLVSVLPDFISQFNVDISQDDQALISSYQPMSGQGSHSQVSEFIDNIKNPIDQCKFCPSKYTKQTFLGTDKKIKIVRF